VSSSRRVGRLEVVVKVVVRRDTQHREVKPAPQRSVTKDRVKTKTGAETETDVQAC
jgi:hypothetical protein